MVKLIWTDGAFETLRQVRDGLYELAGEEVARQTIQEIYAKTELLLTHPRLGYYHDMKRGIERRILLYGHYWILYGIESDRVSVFGVFHASRNIDVNKL